MNTVLITFFIGVFAISFVWLIIMLVQKRPGKGKMIAACLLSAVCCFVAVKYSGFEKEEQISGKGAEDSRLKPRAKRGLKELQIAEEGGEIVTKSLDQFYEESKRAKMRSQILNTYFSKINTSTFGDVVKKVYYDPEFESAIVVVVGEGWHEAEERDRTIATRALKENWALMYELEEDRDKRKIKIIDERGREIGYY